MLTSNTINVGQLLADLAKIIEISHFAGAFFADAEGKLRAGEIPSLEPWSDPRHLGFRVCFPDGSLAGIYEFHGSLFGEVTHDHAHASGQIVHRAKEARGVFNRVLDHLTSPAAA